MNKLIEIEDKRKKIEEVERKIGASAAMRSKITEFNKRHSLVKISTSKSVRPTLVILK